MYWFNNNIFRLFISDRTVKALFEQLKWKCILHLKNRIPFIVHFAGNHVKNLIFLFCLLWIIKTSKRIARKKCSAKCKEFESTSFSLFQWSLQIANSKNKAKCFFSCKKSKEFSVSKVLSKFLSLVKARHDWNKP